MKQNINKSPLNSRVKKTWTLDALKTKLHVAPLENFIVGMTNQNTELSSE